MFAWLVSIAFLWFFAVFDPSPLTMCINCSFYIFFVITMPFLGLFCLLVLFILFSVCQVYLRSCLIVTDMPVLCLCPCRWCLAACWWIGDGGLRKMPVTAMNGELGVISASVRAPAEAASSISNAPASASGRPTPHSCNTLYPSPSLPGCTAC